MRTTITALALALLLAAPGLAPGQMSAPGRDRPVLPDRVASGARQEGAGHRGLHPQPRSVSGGVSDNGL